MFTIKGIDHIVLATCNIAKMLDFYCNILGGHIERSNEKYGLTQIRIGRNLIDLHQVDSPGKATQKNLEHFCLQIQPFNYEDLQRYFDEKGIQLHRYGKRYSSQGLAYSCYLHDPEGNEIELTGYQEQ